jgi:hypothetical protein
MVILPRVPMKNRPRILLLDTETFPNKAYVWGKYDQNVIRFTQETCLAMFGAKWLGESGVIIKGLNDYKGYRAGSYDDKSLVTELWTLLNEADIVIAHNGDQFDVKVCQARFIFHGMKPPKPFKTVDTKKVAKKYGRFNSNKLDDLGELLTLGRKIKTDFDLWNGCIDGDKASWARMARYQKQDVLLLERVYLRFRPWINNHPNFTVVNRKACAKCGSNSVTYWGFAVTQSRRYRRFFCNDCGGWGRDVKCEDGARRTNL